MVTKIGAGGHQQPYIPEGNGDKSGEYASFDSSCLNSTINKVSNIVGYDNMVKFAYKQHNPPLFEGEHLKSRLRERGIARILIAEALLKPLHISDVKYDENGRPSITYYGPNVTVYINPNTGKITTVHKTRKNVRNKFKEKSYVSR